MANWRDLATWRQIEALESQAVYTHMASLDPEPARVCLSNLLDYGEKQFDSPEPSDSIHRNYLLLAGWVYDLDANHIFRKPILPRVSKHLWEPLKVPPITALGEEAAARPKQAGLLGEES